MKTENLISIKSKEELEILREAGRILAAIIKELQCFLKSGMVTRDIDLEAEKLMSKYKVKAAFKGYRGFPASICLSINEEIVHGIPGGRILKKGDVVSLDVGIIHRNFYSDTAMTVGVDEISAELKKLLEVTEQSLTQGIAQAKVNSHLSDISHAVQVFVESKGFSVVRDFVGHGIGKQLHEDPEIPNFGPAGQGPLLKEGMVFAIEPMVNVGNWQTKILGDGWSVVTADGKPSAHFEHTIAITSNGPEVLTKE